MRPKDADRMANNVDPDDTALQELSDLLPMALRESKEKSKGPYL